MIRGTAQIVAYNTTQFPFQSIMQQYVLSRYPVTLPMLHRVFPSCPVVGVSNDQATPILAFLYGCDPLYQHGSPGSWHACYLKFVRWLADTTFQESLVYQRKPTLRCQMPNNKSVGDFHRDSDYGHPPEEWNCFIPLTDCRDSMTIHIESSPDRGDYAPQQLAYGDCLIFDSALRHGNIMNTENLTRLSFDFRVIPISQYRGGCSTASHTQGIPFRIGEYYDVL